MVFRSGLFVRAFVFESVETQFSLSPTSEPIIFLISDWSIPGRTKSSNKMWNESIKLPYWSPCADLNAFRDANKYFQIGATMMALKSSKVRADDSSAMSERNFENFPDRVELRNLIIALDTVRFEHL